MLKLPESNAVNIVGQNDQWNWRNDVRWLTMKEQQGSKFGHTQYNVPEVASSSRSNAGDLITALLIAILCFWPPDSWTPLSPTSVSYPSGNALMNEWAFANLAASIACSLVAPGQPYVMFESMDPPNSTGSCVTTPIRRLEAGVELERSESSQ